MSNDAEAIARKVYNADRKAGDAHWREIHPTFRALLVAMVRAGQETRHE